MNKEISLSLHDPENRGSIVLESYLDAVKASNRYYYLVHCEHPLQEVNELSPIRFLSQQLTTLKISRNIHLTNIVETVKNILPRLLRFDARLGLVLFRCFQSPKRICTCK